MLLARSPTLTFALLFSICSICLTIFTFSIKHEDTSNFFQLLIICPPLNSIFLFLFSVTWIERRFRLSYIPLICLFILMFSSVGLMTVSTQFFSLSMIMYFNFLFYAFFSLIFFGIILITIICYTYGALCIHRYRNMMTVEQRNSETVQDVEPLRIDKLVFSLPSPEELTVFMSKLPGRRIRHDIRNIKDDLEQIEVDTIITLNEHKELSFMNRTNKNIYDMDTYSTYIKRANIEHIIYPIRDRFVPKSVSDYLQLIYYIVINAGRSNSNRILVHCMGGMGRTGLTVVCLELICEHIRKDNAKQKNEQRFCERFCHYPLLLTKACRVCQAIGNVRRARPGTIHNPLQIMFAHELYARLQSSSYMQQIKSILHLDENLLGNDYSPLNQPLATPIDRTASVKEVK